LVADRTRRHSVFFILGHSKLDFSFPSTAHPFLRGPRNYSIIVPGSPLFATW